MFNTKWIPRMMTLAAIIVVLMMALLNLWFILAPLAIVVFFVHRRAERVNQLNRRHR